MVVKVAPAPSPSRRLPATAAAIPPCLLPMSLSTPQPHPTDTPIIAAIKGNLRAHLLIRRIAYAVTKLTAPSASPNHGVWCRQSCSTPPQPLGAACRKAHAASNGCHQASLTSLVRTNDLSFLASVIPKPFPHSSSQQPTPTDLISV